MANSRTPFRDQTRLRLDAAALGAGPPPALPAARALRIGGPGHRHRPGRPLGTNSGATSYHLRKLEAVGLVADTGEGEGKRRLWRAATDFHSYYPSDFAGDEDSETALNWLSATTCATSPPSRSAGSTCPLWPPPGSDAGGISDDLVVATPEQLSAMRDRDRRGGRPLPPGRAGQPRGEAHRGLLSTLVCARPRDRACPMSAPHLSPRSAERRLYLLTTTRWLSVGFVVGIFILVQTGRGLTIAQAATIGSVMGLTCFFLDCPRAASRMPWAAGPATSRPRCSTWWPSWVTPWRRASGRSWWRRDGGLPGLDSGPLEARFVDTVHLTTPGADVDRQLSHTGSILGGAIAVGAALFGLLIWWNPAATVFGHEDASALDAAVWVSAALTVVHLVAACARHEGAPPHRRLRAHAPGARAE